MKPAIEVSHLTKEYRLGAMTSLRQGLSSLGARLRGQALPANRPFKALDDVSFIVQPGEVVGVIGHNGAGKSTLLKMISRITTPTDGSVKVNGRIAPLIEVGAGFIGDFTGRENVYLNGAILGLKRKEIDRKFDEIVAFAEMEKFIDTPVKHYSSGMQVKLAFAVATSVDSEILIVDEVLAVGDLAFQRKCFDRMESLIKHQHKTVLMVSHNIRQVERLCSRVMVLDHGHKVIEDTPQTACNYFYEQSEKQISDSRSVIPVGRGTPVHSAGDLKLLELILLNADGRPTHQVGHGETCTVKLRFWAARRLENLAFGLGIHTADLLYVANDDNTLAGGPPQHVPEGEFTVLYEVERLALFPGSYAFRLGVAFADTDGQLFYDEHISPFQVSSSTISASRVVGQGFFPVGGRWKFPAVAAQVA